MTCRMCPARAASNAMGFCAACWLAFLIVAMEIDRGWKSVN